MNRLIACTSCHRHVRTTDDACPFCGAATPKTAPVRGRPVGRLGRAAIVVATTTGVAAATNLAGCGDGPILAGDAYGLADVTNDYVTGADAYGIPFDQFAPDVDASDADADADAQTFGDAYGIPPDTGTD